MDWSPSCQQMKRTEGNTKLQPKAEAWPHPFFIHYQTHDSSHWLSDATTRLSNYI